MAQHYFNKKPLAERQSHVASIIQRLAQAYGVEEKQAVATCLGMPLKLIESWICEGYLPTDAIIKCHLATGFSLDWLTHGTGPVVKVTYHS
ncbi:MAG: hypothetical protein ACI9FJ_000937 [Alteromonadaceae bacterium]|jgi:hypothetical protein